MPLLTEQKLRLAIREEIETSREYKNLSARQKYLLEQGVVKKVVGAIGGAIKGAVGKLVGGGNKPATTGAQPAQAASPAGAAAAPAAPAANESEKIDDGEITSDEVAIAKQVLNAMKKYTMSIDNAYDELLKTFNNKKLMSIFDKGSQENIVNTFSDERILPNSNNLINAFARQIKNATK